MSHVSRLLDTFVQVEQVKNASDVSRVRTSLMLDEDVLDRVKYVSKRLGMNVSEFMRAVIDAVLSDTELALGLNNDDGGQVVVYADSDYYEELARVQIEDYEENVRSEFEFINGVVSPSEEVLD